VKFRSKARHRQGEARTQPLPFPGRPRAAIGGDRYRRSCGGRFPRVEPCEEIAMPSLVYGGTGSLGKRSPESILNLSPRSHFVDNNVRVQRRLVPLLPYQDLNTVRCNMVVMPRRFPQTQRYLIKPEKIQPV